jgi:DNA-directed RNA polymerase omega subunit
LDKYVANIDSKFRYIIVAAKRAKQLLKGAKPKIKTKSRNPIRIAQQEVMQGLVEFEILPIRQDDAPDADDRVLVGGDGIAVEEVGEVEVAVDEKDEGAGAEAEEAEDEEAGEEEIEENLEGGIGTEKDEDA